MHEEFGDPRLGSFDLLLKMDTISEGVSSLHDFTKATVPGKNGKHSGLIWF